MTRYRQRRRPAAAGRRDRGNAVGVAAVSQPGIDGPPRPGGAAGAPARTKSGPARTPGPALAVSAGTSAQFVGQSTPWLFSPSAPAGTGPIPL